MWHKDSRLFSLLPHTVLIFCTFAAAQKTTTEGKNSLKELRFERTSLYPTDLASIAVDELDKKLLTEAAKGLYDYYEGEALIAELRQFPEARQEFRNLDGGGRRSEFFLRWQKTQAGLVEDVSPEIWDYKGEVLWSAVLLSRNQTAKCDAEPSAAVGADGSSTASAQKLQTCSSSTGEAALVGSSEQYALPTGILATLQAMYSSAFSLRAVPPKHQPSLLEVRYLQKRIKQLTTAYFQKKLPTPMKHLEVFLHVEVLLPLSGNIRPHVHAGAILAGMFFCDLQPDEEIVVQFYDPRGAVPPFGATHFVYPAAGELVLYPSWLSHSVAWSLRGGNRKKKSSRRIHVWHALVYDERQHIDWEADLASSFISNSVTTVMLPPLDRTVLHKL
ncbi:unnamed protein product [Amoebophrya sp. A120]|nr:unnamed protein product [Amoebophrya sp. A120]|eukprot:GSA120T00004756001.1